LKLALGLTLSVDRIIDPRDHYLSVIVDGDAFGFKFLFSKALTVRTSPGPIK
jgi:hypothetical protein